MLVKPSKAQVAWHKLERIMFIHYGPAAWQGTEYDDLSTPLSDMNPESLDVEQWCKAALSWEAKQIIFVAKHVGGFCFWQTNTSPYGIKETPYKSGKGDVVEELYTACKARGLKFGLYLSPADTYFGAYVGGGGKTTDESLQDTYNQVYRAQLTELLERYPDCSELWFDGGIVIQVKDILEKYSQNAAILQCKELSNIRWCGNENGMVPYPSWNVLSKEKLVTGFSTKVNDNPEGDAWAGLEMDTPLYNHHWFWSEEKEKDRKTLDQLMEIFYKSVGRGGVLLLNATPNTDGLIPQKDMQAYVDFGKEIERRFLHPLAETSGEGEEVVLEFEKPTMVNHVVLEEVFEEGHRIREFVLEGEAQGAWSVIFTGSAVGVKLILPFEEVLVTKLRVRIVSMVEVPLIRSFSAYRVTGIDLQGLLELIEEKPHLYDAFREEVTEIVLGEKAQKEYTIDLTPFIQMPGQYWLSMEGKHPFCLSDEMLLLEGKEAPDFIEEHTKNASYILSRTAVVTAREMSAFRFSAESAFDNQVKIYISKI